MPFWFLYILWKPQKSVSYPIKSDDSFFLTMFKTVRSVTFTLRVSFPHGSHFPKTQTFFLFIFVQININFPSDFPGVTMSQQLLQPALFHLVWTSNCRLCWTMRRWGILREGQRNSLTFRFSQSPFCCCYVGQARWCWTYGFGRPVVCWLADRTAGSTGEKPLSLNYQPVTVHSQRERSLSPHSSTLSVASSSSRPQFADAGTTQTGHGTSQGNTSVRQWKTRTVIMLM